MKETAVASGREPGLTRFRCVSMCTLYQLDFQKREQDYGARMRVITHPLYRLLKDGLLRHRDGAHAEEGGFAEVSLRPFLSPYSAALPFCGQSTWNMTDLSPELI